MATRVDNTMVEWLQKMNKNIAEAKMLPDADMAFLVTMENMILDRAKKPVNDMRAQGTLPPAPQPMGAGGGGVMASPPMPGADELSRMLAPGQGPQ
jgi:hypothetical protein